MVVVADEEGARSFLETLQEMLPRLAQTFQALADERNILFMYMFNSARLEEGLNSISTLWTFGARHNIVVMATDELVCPNMGNAGVTCIFTGLTMRKNVPWYGDLDRFKHFEFVRLALYKFMFVTLGVISGVSVFYSDADTVFLQDPYPYLGLAEEAAAPIYDVWIQDGSRGCLNATAWEYNTGLMLWQASGRTRRFLTQFLADAEVVLNHELMVQIHDDQTLLSFYLHSHPDEFLEVRVLPKLQFPNGDVFFNQRLCGDDSLGSRSSWEDRCCGVVVVHNNFILDPDGDAKIERLLESGLWYRPPPNSATVTSTRPRSAAACCMRPPSYILWPMLSTLPHPTMHGDSVAEGGRRAVVRVRAGATSGDASLGGASNGWSPYIDLAEALRGGRHVVLEIDAGGDVARRQAPPPSDLVRLWDDGLLNDLIDVVLGGSIGAWWLFLASARCSAAVDEWLRSEDDGLPPVGSFRARLRFPQDWVDHAKTGSSEIDVPLSLRTLNAVQACRDVPCW